MQNLSERDMAYDILYGCKAQASEYMQATLESASPRCRDVFHRLHDDCMRDQWRVWQFLHNRREYRISAAPAQEIDGVRERMEHLWRTEGPAGDAGRRQVAGSQQGRRAAAAGQPGWDGDRWGNGRRTEPATVGAAPYGVEGTYGDRGTAGGYGGGTGYAAAQSGGYGSSGAGGGYGAYGAATTNAGGYAGGGYGAATTNAGGYAGSGGYGVAGTYNEGTGFGGAEQRGEWAEEGGVSFEPDHNLPEGTTFESDRGVATGFGTVGERRGENAPGNRWGAGPAGRGSGARPAEGSSRTFGQTTWSSESTRRSQPRY